MATQSRSLFDMAIVVPALKDCVRKLSPAKMIKNPVMFVTEIGAVLTTIDCALAWTKPDGIAFELQVSLWLWFTAFVGLNLIQASFTGVCPAAALFKRFGVKSGCAFS